MTTPEQPIVRLRPEIVASRAYAQGRTPPSDGFKLSSNENHYPPLPGVIEAVNAASYEMNRYPDAAATMLRARLSERFDVDLSEIHVGSGSVALLAQLLAAAAGPGDDVIYAWRSFEAYPGLVTVTGATSVQVPNRADGGHDLDAMAAAITDRARVVLVCSPNNPTGPAVTAVEFRAFMTRVPSDLLVVLDEAYYEFATGSDVVNGISELPRYRNLVVLRTFSKAYGLAALRIGYAIGAAEILDAARSAAIPLSVTSAAQTAALASLDHEDVLLERVARIAMQRDEFRSALIEQGWDVPDAQGNFVWLATGSETEHAADAFFAAGLTVRAFPPEGIRISVGEPDAVEKVLQVAGDIVANLPKNHPAKRLG